MLVIAYIPCGSEYEAKKISEALIKERLVACANIVTSTSMFKWAGKFEENDEWIILAKTVPERFEDLKKRVKGLHSYDLPCIIGIPVVDFNEEYKEWVRKSVSSDGQKISGKKPGR